MMQHHHEKIFLQGKAGQLEALYQAGEADKPAIVVCHPHPLYGGTMRNKVVYWIARAFEDAGCSVLRFNFRGVEKSAGEWADGEGEADDVLVALGYLKENNPSSPLWLAGFSFGTYAGLRATQKDKRVERMFAIAPAVNIWSFDFMLDETRPLTVVSGSADEIVPFDQVQAWIQRMPEHVRFHAIAEAGHFFPKHMQAMTDILMADSGLQA